jgi:hypothetical protein
MTHHLFSGVAVGAIRQNTFAHEIPLQTNPISFMEEDSNSSLEELASASTSDQGTGMVTGESVDILPQQPFPSSQQHLSNVSGSIPFITSENVPDTGTPTGTTAANTAAATSGGDYLTPSDNNRFIPATTHVTLNMYYIIILLLCALYGRNNQQ